ncbi:MAG: preprotein translocase subunit YajC [Oscillospiraceae bacterium]|nr:preprotein translocase subunit YajC [Oscillospiraceae bacterium]MBR3610723.1 preprotein translocase subunit YajC [Oscillospiraceae bacterium]
MTNFPYLLSLLGSADASAEGGSILDTIISFAPIIVVVIVFYFMLIRPQQKKDKADKVMRENLDIGDEVVTIGGIIGIVVSVKEDTVVIETGSDRSKIRILKSAVSQNISARDKND